LQYLHSLPNPRQWGDHVASGYWNTSAGLTGASRTGAGGGAGAGPFGPPGSTRTSSKALKTSARTPRVTSPVSPSPPWGVQPELYFRIHSIYERLDGFDPYLLESVKAIVIDSDW